MWFRPRPQCFGNRRRSSATSRIAKTREHRSGPQDAIYGWTRINFIVVIIAVISILFLAYLNSRYVLSEDDLFVITQFGKAVGEARTVPGEYFKIPFVQKVHCFKKKYYLYDNMQEIPTKGKKYISFKKRVFWKISNPVQFYKKLNGYDLAKEYVLDITGATERKIITSHRLEEIIGGDSDSDGITNFKCSRSIERKILEEADRLIASAGLSINNIEARITYPIIQGKP